MKNNHSIGGVSSAALGLGFLMLAVSTYHATSFLWKMTDEDYQKAAMLATVVSLLASSHVLARILGFSWGKGRVFLMLMCAGCVVMIEMFSIGTSATSMNSRAIEGIRSENHSSPEYKMAMNNVNNYQNQIIDLRNNMNSLPNTYVTKRQQIQYKIERLQSKLEAAQASASNVNVSTTGAAIQGMSDRWNITAEDIALTASIMLSITPLVMGIGVGVMRSDSGEGENSVKKPKHPNLKTAV